MSQKSEWERGKDALETMLKYESIETVEAIAKMVSDTKFRASMKFKIVKNHIKDYTT